MPAITQNVAEVGMTVYIQKLTPTGVPDEKQPPKSAQLTKIGRVYYTVKMFGSDKLFKISNLLDKGECGYTQKMFFSEQDVCDEIERDKLANKLYKNNFHNLSLAQLRSIFQIIEKE